MANWTNVTREPETGLPTMLVQAVSIAFVMCVCELVSAPVMVSAAGGAFALMPWFLVACLFAVAFVYTVGFVLLWAADSFAARLKRRDALMPLIYAVIGCVGFGIWGYCVYPATMNSIITRAGLATLSQGDSLMIGINCAVVGLAAFFLGTAADAARHEVQGQDRRHGRSRHRARRVRRRRSGDDVVASGVRPAIAERCRRADLIRRFGGSAGQRRWRRPGRAHVRGGGYDIAMVSAVKACITV